MSFSISIITRYISLISHEISAHINKFKLPACKGPNKNIKQIKIIFLMSSVCLRCTEIIAQFMTKQKNTHEELGCSFLFLADLGGPACGATGKKKRKTLSTRGCTSLVRLSTIEMSHTLGKVHTFRISGCSVWLKRRKKSPHPLCTVSKSQNTTAIFHR